MRNCCLIMLLLLSNLYSAAQTCQCVNTFDSVVAYMERNYAGAKDKITPQTRKAYRKYTAKYRRIAQQAKKDQYCLFAVDQWLEFFKDHHIALAPAADDAASAIEKAIAATETIALSAETVNALRAKTGAGIEGIYSNANYEVALVKNENGSRSYAAILLSSKYKAWQPGMVKFELIKTGDQEFAALWYNKNHNLTIGKVSFKNDNGLLWEGWNKVGYTRPAPANKPLFEEENNAVVYFKQLDATTNYLRIKGFDIEYYKLIDSVVNANLSLISSTPHLIIDIRGNGGGGDRSYKSLKPLIYTQPVKLIGVDILVTPENIIANEKVFAAHPDIPKEFVEQYRSTVKEVPQGQRAFVSAFPDKTDTLKNTPAFPEKVGIIINKRCASSAEQFLLDAIQSKKVILFGEHTRGVLDYFNMRDVDFACPAFTLSYATTRSRRLDIGQGIDNKGIAPHVKIDFNDSNWLEKVKQTLQQGIKASQ